eukprot:TRINITY_DN81128_c0_g1_i1.p1 TRINITY_DN81128_c0_g1~~TRINITY_DN81128_c0_g1_i1.p1  ORF type:complete len:298 (-),score=106.93 TRINITY_DN81128_c0_g1_i1:95-988(-)
MDPAAPSEGSSLAFRVSKRSSRAEERRKRRREDRVERRKALKKKRKQSSIPPSSSSKDENDEKRMGEKASKEEKLKRKERLLEVLQSKEHRLVVDLDFDGIMTERECRSLGQQLMQMYGRNNRSDVPMNLWFTSWGHGGSVFMKDTCDSDKWRVNRSEKPVEEVFDLEDMVYFTADAEEVIDELDPSKVYVIGGFVDRNRHKGLTLEKAKKLGIPTAKLPIDPSRLALRGSVVLTINQVFEILMNHREGMTWDESLKAVIPMRKQCTCTTIERKDETAHDMEVLEDGADKGGSTTIT